MSLFLAVRLPKKKNQVGKGDDVLFCNEVLSFFIVVHEYKGHSLILRENYTI